MFAPKKIQLIVGFIKNTTILKLTILKFKNNKNNYKVAKQFPATIAQQST